MEARGVRAAAALPERALPGPAGSAASSPVELFFE
jgi:hypothetical protein